VKRQCLGFEVAFPAHAPAARRARRVRIVPSN
jgi:hypothetical protein